MRKSQMLAFPEPSVLLLGGLLLQFAVLSYAAKRNGAGGDQEGTLHTSTGPGTGARSRRVCSRALVSCDTVSELACLALASQLWLNMLART